MIIKTNRIKRHIPLFVDCDDEDLVVEQFHSLEELLAIEWVKNWSTFKGFSRYSVTHLPLGECYALMATVDLTPWCLGFMDYDVPELPRT